MAFATAIVVCICYLFRVYAHSGEQSVTPIEYETQTTDSFISPEVHVATTPKIHVVTMFSARYTGALANNALNMQRLGLPYNTIYALDSASLSLCISAFRTSFTICEPLHATVPSVDTVTNNTVHYPTIVCVD